MIFSNFPLIGQAINPSAAKWLPSSYMDISNIVLDQNPWQHPSITWVNGMGYIILLSILLIFSIIGVLKMKKRI